MPPSDTVTLSSELQRVWEEGSWNQPTEYAGPSQIFVTIKQYIQIWNKPEVKLVSADIFLPRKLSERYVNVQGAGVLCWLLKRVTTHTAELSWMPLFHFKRASVCLHTARLHLTLACKCRMRRLGQSDFSYFPRCPSFIEHFCLQELASARCARATRTKALGSGWAPVSSFDSSPKHPIMLSFSHWGVGEWHPPHDWFISANLTPRRVSAPSSYPSHRPTDPEICTQRF